MADEAPRASVLLLAFGGPANLDEVGSFMERLMGRAPTPEMVEGARKKYELIGGGSPLPAIVGEQAEAVARTLNGAAAVHVAMRYSSPTIDEAVAAAREAGDDKLIAISMSPHYSAVSTGAYRDALTAAVESEGFEGEVVLVQSWSTHSGFLEALAERLEEARTVADGRYHDWPVVFTAHSLPESDAGVDRYRFELEETVGAVIVRTGIPAWWLAYQSRGRAEGAWLGPMLEDVMGEIAGQGAPGVVVQPVGFTSEHMETLYDLDIVAKTQAEALGLGFVRVPTVGTHPKFIAALAEVARGHIGR